MFSAILELSRTANSLKRLAAIEFMAVKPENKFNEAETP